GVEPAAHVVGEHRPISREDRVSIRSPSRRGRPGTRLINTPGSESLQNSAIAANILSGDAAPPSYQIEGVRLKRPAPLGKGSPIRCESARSFRDAPSEVYPGPGDPGRVSGDRQRLSARCPDDLPREPGPLLPDPDSTILPDPDGDHVPGPADLFAADRGDTDLLQLSVVLFALLWHDSELRRVLPGLPASALDAVWFVRELASGQPDSGRTDSDAGNGCLCSLR